MRDMKFGDLMYSAALSLSLLLNPTSQFRMPGHCGRIDRSGFDFAQPLRDLPNYEVGEVLTACSWWRFSARWTPTIRYGCTTHQKHLLVREMQNNCWSLTIQGGQLNSSVGAHRISLSSLHYPSLASEAAPALSGDLCYSRFKSINSSPNFKQVRRM